ncbi:hypothetical protein OHA74_20745 [Streptomyces phaeochromogenes]|uniref:hypothetical protein n=1 Tax=Streptomyces phaeochromogenes TaxID=1923 RepID=UPI002E2BEF3D|nr:hypothetical protein [Streptomyces phaeochromogenes]
MPKVKVAFPHKGEDGKLRDVGQTVEVSKDEADRRVRDGFVTLVVEPAKPVAKATPKTETVAVEKPVGK